MLFLQTLLDDPVFFLRTVAIVIFSVTLHELAHGYAALLQGDETPRESGHLTLNPLLHMGWESILMLCVAGIAWGQMPVNPARFRSAKWGNVFVSAAGPLSNLALGILFIALLNLISIASLAEILSSQFFTLAAKINLILFLFNLVPIPPLDGFHVLSEFFPALKILNEDMLGLFALAVLLVNPSFAQGLAAIANWVIETLS